MYSLYEAALLVSIFTKRVKVSSWVRLSCYLLDFFDNDRDNKLQIFNFSTCSLMNNLQRIFIFMRACIAKDVYLYELTQFIDILESSVVIGSRYEEV